MNIEISRSVIDQIPKGQRLNIKLEIDTDPPSGFSTESKYVLLPIPFAIRTYTLPDLFAGKMHALLFRQWKTRIKGRDWYDFVWFAANHPRLNLVHLEKRMRQSGHWNDKSGLTPETLRAILKKKIDNLEIGKALMEVELFAKNPDSLTVWSTEFFHSVADRIEFL